MGIKKENIDLASLSMCVLMLISLFVPGFMTFSKSRVNMPDPVSAKVLFGGSFYIVVAAVFVLVVLSVVKGKSGLLNFITGAFSNIFLISVMLMTNFSYDRIPYDKTDMSRMSFGLGFVLMVIALYGINVLTESYITNRWMKYVNRYLVWLIVFGLVAAGFMDNYSVMKEYAANSRTFMRYLNGHISLCVKALTLSILIGVPTGYWCYSRRVADRVIMFIISIFETMPMLALFAIIRIPCNALGESIPALKSFGVGNHGLSVSVIALTIYGLYLIISNSRAAFTVVDKDYKEVASALGMSPLKIFFRIQLPLALPVVLTGIRLAMISTITSAALAAFFGGGGLGQYINLGTNGSALDLQLLAVIPIFVLTVAADLIMRVVIYLIRYLTGGKTTNGRIAEAV